MNFGSVMVKALMVLVLLFLLSLAGAITFPLLTVVTGGAGAGLSSILLFLLAIVLLSLVGNLIARGIQSVKKSAEALIWRLLVFLHGSYPYNIRILNIPLPVRVNLAWTGNSWYSPILTLLFIGIPLCSYSS